MKEHPSRGGPVAGRPAHRGQVRSRDSLHQSGHQSHRHHAPPAGLSRHSRLPGAWVAERVSRLPTGDREWLGLCPRNPIHHDRRPHHRYTSTSSTDRGRGMAGARSIPERRPADGRRSGGRRSGDPRPTEDLIMDAARTALGRPDYLFNVFLLNKDNGWLTPSCAHCATGEDASSKAKRSARCSET